MKSLKKTNQVGEVCEGSQRRARPKDSEDATPSLSFSLGLLT